MGYMSYLDLNNSGVYGIYVTFDLDNSGFYGIYVTFDLNNNGVNVIYVIPWFNCLQLHPIIKHYQCPLLFSYRTIYVRLSQHLQIAQNP